MKFTSPSLVSEAIWNMRLSDLPRGTNRASIDRLMNGDPPYTEQERQENNIEINVNFLDAPQLVSDARRSYHNGFQAPGKFFTVTVDSGPVYARQRWGRIITAELQKIMKSSRLYAEVLDSQFASCTLHGIGPAVWTDAEHWIPEEKGIEDILIPSGTLRSFRNLDHFAVFYQYTPEQLKRMTSGPKVDKAWNMPMVKNALEWAHNQTQSQLSYSDLFAPEKVEERFKQDSGFYGTDAVPTIDFWKFFYHDDSDNQCGWRMRMVLDTPGEWEVGGRKAKKNAKMPRKNCIGTDQGEWFYNPGSRVYADSIEQLAHFQFADLSAVAPFKYHTVRSLGWLLYSVCHLQNRLLCKYNEAVFENLLQYFRGNEGDKTRVQKIDLHNFGFVPDGVAFVSPNERWQVNEKLVESAIDRNRQRMEYSAAQYREGQDQGAQNRDKTATQVMAEVNSSMSMVGSMLTQAYRYQSYQYKEIARRFCMKNSSDPEVRQFRARVLHAGVPERILDSSMWNIEPEKVMGGGNKTLELAMADSLLQMRPLLDPDSQREVDRINIASKTSNDELAQRLVPEVKPISDATHDAQLATASIMMGLPVRVKSGINHPDYIEALMANMAIIMKPIEGRGGMAKPDELMGLKNMVAHTSEHIQILSQDKSASEKVAQYGKELGELTNLIKAYEQRLMEQMQKRAESQAQAGNGQGIDPKDEAKVKAQMLMAQVKAKSAEQSHAARTAQKQISWEREEQRKERQHQLDMQRKMKDSKVDTASKDLLTASEIRRNALKAENEPPTETTTE